MRFFFVSPDSSQLRGIRRARQRVIRLVRLELPVVVIHAARAPIRMNSPTGSGDNHQRVVCDAQFVHSTKFMFVGRLSSDLCALNCCTLSSMAAPTMFGYSRNRALFPAGLRPFPSGNRGVTKKYLT